ncbi:MAG: sensor histidine kinase [Undibacterium sp.]|nr:sensor histidine kinase [Opitutaceae bacterium]
MHQLGACRWSGTTTPLRAHVKSSGPSRLAEFAPGGANWFENVYFLDQERMLHHVAVASRGEPAPALEYRMVTGGATIVWVRHWWVASEGDRANLEGGRVHGFVQIIDERKELEAECIRISERERHHIGQELHDDMCQILAGVSCMLEVFGRRVKTTLPDLAPKVKELVTEVNAGMARARSLAHTLVPSRLVALGLRGALVELARQAGTLRGVTITTDLGSAPMPLQSEEILHLYRIAQEAIGNAVKHGQATRIALKLQLRDGGLSLTICDNGSGLTPDTQQTPGIGLDIMKHRAFEIGADFTICAGEDGGTVVRVDFPGVILKTCSRRIRL